jgi:predicted GTPase
MRRVLIMGAGGRDFHNFNTVFRDDPDTTVVAFTGARIPGIDDRRYPATLAGARYPDGIPIRPEQEPYGDLQAMGVQRFASIDDIDAANPTIEEREEYEEPVRQGLVVYAGVDYAAVLRRAESEADVIIWDGGNNDFSFFAPDLTITVADALRPGHELAYHPGETNFRMADVIVVNKIDAAAAGDVAAVVANARRVNPSAAIVRAASPVVLEPGPSLVSRRVLVVEDGPTITHGGMAFGAGMVAARHDGATEFVDPRPFAVGSIAATFASYPHIGNVLPAMGYGSDQLAELETTIAAATCDVVVTGTPMDLSRIIRIGRPVRHASYEILELGHPDLAELLEPYVERWITGRPARLPPSPTDS